MKNFELEKNSVYRIKDNLYFFVKKPIRKQIFQEKDDLLVFIKSIFEVHSGYTTDLFFSFRYNLVVFDVCHNDSPHMNNISNGLIYEKL